MKKIYHPASSRGYVDHGWLKSAHTFSFADYYNRARMHFGVLRVINDDFIEGGSGFGTHPHNDMEIVTLPLEGVLKHQDSMGNSGVIREGDIQVMSAGTGITHSELNASDTTPVKFLQIWVFPREKGITPRYDQMHIADSAKPNDFQLIISPYEDEEGLWIHQDAWFHLACFDKGVSKEYYLKKEGNSIYIFVIYGKARIGEQILNERDGYGIWDTDHFSLEALEPSEILLMEVPVELPQ
ncbi:pirin family protein [Proteiniphilum sp. UBA5384]|uniref:pirin family protein n=1 Tax=Proteiniphilum sp. UBA5384 TaxID=1947279 RepID=UPI0025E17466|nr:pirin family protein [Proteiniphilum sp. UBA5384]